jgi:type IV pilus assembly protein PilB
MSPYRSTKTEIGKLLIQKGLITNEQLKEALILQREREKDKLLGQILIQLGYLSKDDLYFALAIQSGYPYIDIKRCVVDPEVMFLIPGIMVKKYQVFAIDKIEDVVTVAMVNPLDNLAIDQIQDIAKSNIKVFLTTPSDIKEIILRYFGQGAE